VQKEREKMPKTAPPKPKLHLPARASRKSISLTHEGLVEAGYLPGGKSLPLVMQPAQADLDLAEWTRNNVTFVEAELLKHGAILFRGFNVDSAPQFEQCALAVAPDLFNENGEHPRTFVSGKVYTPVFYPPEKLLLWHNENSFNHSWPTRIWFCCQQPAPLGGETPVVDSRQVFQRINPQIRRRFAAKRIMYVRNYGDGMGLDWQAVFQTTDKTEVERKCRDSLMEFEWKSGNRLRTQCLRPAVVRHPQTGESVWFNQAQHWHISCLDPEAREVITSSYSMEDLPRNCYYGDGTPIEDDVMQEILEVYGELESSFPWRRGDLLMLDNLLAAHGRKPYVGERKMLVAMGAMMNYDAV
jgi:alpha-ketoglutarate-dependent taurine dioxygenase